MKSYHRANPVIDVVPLERNSVSLSGIDVAQHDIIIVASNLLALTDMLQCQKNNMQANNSLITAEIVTTALIFSSNYPN